MARGGGEADVQRPEASSGVSTDTGADATVRCLVKSGIDVMFANPGTTEMPLVESIDRIGGMRAVLGLHENVVTGAADGYARMTSRPACTLLHLGPGLANGLANLHNAARAGAPVVNIIGDMATWHQSADALLSMDINAVAGSVSCVVRTANSAQDAATDTVAAVAATRDFRAGRSRVATLVMAHDAMREPAGNTEPPIPPPPLVARPDGPTAFERAAAVDSAVHGAPDASHGIVARCVTALREHGDAACLFIGGPAACADSGLIDAARCAASTGAVLMCENAFPRIDRGAGRPAVARLAYFPNDAKRDLARFRAIIFVGARVPVAMFGYEDGISEVVDSKAQDLIVVDTHDPSGALHVIADQLGAAPYTPPPPARVPAPPKGRLTAQKLSQAIAAAQPEDAIIVDESLTSGGAYWEQSAGCPAFTHLTLTGGSIGQGPPLSVGCAVACPSRRVINFQADGSCLYTSQALWTQAREKLRVTTVICNNSTYQILRFEQQKQQLSTKGTAARSLTDLTGPAIDWVSLAKGYGVEAGRAQTAEELTALLQHALTVDGPYLIEARL